MRPDAIADNGDVEVGATHVTVRRPRERRRIACRILHRETAADGRIVWLVLDRVVHELFQDFLGDWRVSGAITTELRKS